MFAYLLRSLVVVVGVDVGLVVYCVLPVSQATSKRKALFAGTNCTNTDAHTFEVPNQL